MFRPSGGLSALAALLLLALGAAGCAGNPELHGVYRVGRQEFESARSAFERALELNPASIEALGGLNLLDISTGNVEAAKARMDARLKADETPAVLLLAARTYTAAKDAATAERLLRRALELEPTLLSAYGMLGQLYVSQRRLDEAKREFTVLASRQTKPVAAWTMLGMIHQMQGNAAEAKQAFEQALALEPNAAVAANNLAWMYAEKGENLDVALQLARNAVAAAPTVPEISDTLGWILYLKNLRDLAIPALSRAVELDPRHPVYHYHLGLARVRNGDAARGRQSLERALGKAQFRRRRSSTACPAFSSHRVQPTAICLARRTRAPPAHTPSDWQTFVTGSADPATDLA